MKTFIRIFNLVVRIHDIQSLEYNEDTKTLTIFFAYRNPVYYDHVTQEEFDRISDELVNSDSQD